MSVLNAFLIFMILYDFRINAAVRPLELNKSNDFAYCMHEENEGQIMSLISEMQATCECQHSATGCHVMQSILGNYCWETVKPVYRVLNTSVGSCKFARYERPGGDKLEYREDACAYCIREEKKKEIFTLMDRKITSLCECFRGYLTPICNSIRPKVVRNINAYNFLEDFCVKTVEPLNLILSRSTGPFKIVDIPYITAKTSSNSSYTEAVIFGTEGSKDNTSDSVPPKGSKSKDGRFGLAAPEAKKSEYIRWNFITFEGNRSEDNGWDFVTSDAIKPIDIATESVISKEVRPKENRSEPTLPKSDTSKDKTVTVPLETSKLTNGDIDTSESSKPKYSGSHTVRPEGNKPKDDGTDTVSHESSKPIYNEKTTTVLPEASKSKYGESHSVTPKRSKPIYGVSSETVRSKDYEPLPALPKCGGIDSVPPKGSKSIKSDRNIAPSERSIPKESGMFSTTPTDKQPSQKSTDTNLCFLKTINQNIVSRALCVLKALHQEN